MNGSSNEEEREFRKVYMDYHKIICKVAYSHVRDYYLAQDICQEAFLRLHQYFDSMPKEKIKAWLIVVAVNLARDIRKKGGQYTEIVGLSDWERVKNEERAGNNVEEFLERADARSLCLEALEGLREKNEKWYEILVLVECVGVPRKKIAKAHGISLSTVDGYLKRAKAWLKVNYKDMYQDLYK
ncbi:MAG: RNA polymerase sigma factor [Lachnospiraceae bacterium]|jgi:RNA polymerase sigma factor (sigma-70 family)|nr:RNA polymerase sigma factor [Lachnospiraceae bacterium]MCI9135310.1 RNA polymerase sigma factor [Lachnospiraceae bacterium]